MEKLILTLAERGISIRIANGDLVIKASKDALDDELIALIKENKGRLIEFLSEGNTTGSDKFDRIEPAKEMSGYPLSSSQRRLWVLSHFSETGLNYNIPGVFVFEGRLNRKAFEASINALVDRHESLRTVFRKDDQGEPKQYILTRELSGFKLASEDLRQIPQSDSLVKELVSKECSKGFDLSTGPLIRTTLYRLADRKFVFTYTLHHIVSDGWSMEVLISELSRLYQAFNSGMPDPLPGLKIHYKDFSIWQQKQLKEGRLSGDKQFWLEQFKGELPALNLRSDHPRPLIRSNNGRTLQKKLDKAISAQFKVFVQQQGASLYMGLLALVNTLLFRYTGDKDIILGAAVAGRDHPDLEAQIGFYVNTIALRTRIQADQGFTNLLFNVMQSTFPAYEHQSFPFDELVESLDLHTGSSRNHLFDVMVEFRERNIANKREPLKFGDLDIYEYEGVDQGKSKFDITFFFTETYDGLNLNIEYSSDLFDAGSIDRMVAHLERLMSLVSVDPGMPLEKIDYTTTAEKNKILTEFNATEVSYPGDHTVISLFESQAKKSNGSPAVIFDGVTYTYGALDEKAGRLAAWLQSERKIGRGEAVGIMLDRSEKVIVSILGCLKAGVAYVPVDPGYPSDRKSIIFQDAAFKLLITQSEYLYDLTDFKGDIFCIDIQLDDLKADDQPMDSIAHSADPAYILYTSGSSGTPKGCVITNDNLFNYIQWANAFYFNRPDKPVFGLFTSLSFDLTVTSIFCPLTQGGCLYIYKQHEDVSKILRHTFDAKSGINCIKLTPSHISVLENLEITSPDISCAIVGGEEVNLHHISILKRISPTIDIYNEYGPTEATVGCVVAKLAEDKPVLIGKPIANAKIYLLDRSGGLCPVGVPGEIYISGKCVGQGYLNKKELTAKRFIADPFFEGLRMYKTGDIGEWIPDGNLLFLGREDEQVKIRGHRIEVAEIEYQIKRHPAIKDAVVVAGKDEEDGNQLIAYVVAGQPAQDDLIADLIRFLKSKIPSYMVPARLISVGAIPLTAHGKVDKKSLLDTAGSKYESQMPVIEPRNEIEEKLLLIWREVLGKERIGMKDDFFELGGQSLKATRLLSRITKVFNIEYDFELLFNSPTIEDIANEIERTYGVNNAVFENDNISNSENISI